MNINPFNYRQFCGKTIHRKLKQPQVIQVFFGDFKSLRY